MTKIPTSTDATASNIETDNTYTYTPTITSNIEVENTPTFTPPTISNTEATNTLTETLSTISNTETDKTYTKTLFTTSDIETTKTNTPSEVTTSNGESIIHKLSVHPPSAILKLLPPAMGKSIIHKYCPPTISNTELVRHIQKLISPPATQKLLKQIHFLKLPPAMRKSIIHKLPVHPPSAILKLCTY
ncbi:hypothetical protein EB796_013337 [Bugula neritina]|uniref:Uncharacterized protein n=1 Tax=Bugula neritina TaxID=10212 RepID=A0A7J7JQS5_BUGNE|nr:hypothetical protein EB796_013337 [Bugula neritina]